MKSDFYIHHAKFQNLADKALDWFLRGLRYPPESDERLICTLKRKILMKQALKELDLARKCF